MVYIKQLFLISFSILFLTPSLSAQIDTLIDVVPLAIGRNWTYYYTGLYYQESYQHSSTRIDTGEVSYFVEDVETYPDSLIWVIKEISWFESTIINNYGTYKDTTSETIIFHLKEILSGRHKLYSTEFRRGALSFPYERDIYRYKIDTSNVLILNYEWFGSELETHFQKYLGQTFIKDTIGFYATGLNWYHYFSLISSNILYVNENEYSSTDYDYKLYQNYPNPFNPLTKIKFSVPQAENVQIKVFDFLGKELTTLLDDFRQAGNYELEFDASDISSGVYFYRIFINGYSETKKMVLIK